MILVYASLTGNIRNFVSKLDKSIKTKKLTKGLVLDEHFILITYTTGKGETPKEVEDFFSNESNINNLVGVIGSGNKNWGNNYCFGAIRVAIRYSVPLLHTFELRGLNSDVETVNKIMERMY